MPSAPGSARSSRSPTLNKEEIGRLEAIYKERQSEERLALDQAARGQSAALEVAKLRTRRIAEAIELLSLQGRLNDELAQTARQRIAALERRAAEISRNYRFSPEELERVTKAIQARIAVIEQQLEATNAARTAATSDRDRARQAIDALAQSQERRRSAPARGGRRTAACCRRHPRCAAGAAECADLAARHVSARGRALEPALHGAQQQGPGRAADGDRHSELPPSVECGPCSPMRATWAS